MEHFFSPNSGEDQKKRSSSKTEHFFSPNLGEDQKKKKKKDFIKDRTLLFPKFTLRCTPIQIIGGHADVDHSETVGGIQPNYLGDVSPPGFGTPGCTGPCYQLVFVMLWLSLFLICS